MIKAIISFVYGSNDDDERKVLWEEIIATSTYPSGRNRAWSVLGEFNQFLYGSEHSTADPLLSTRAMRKVGKCLRKAGLLDLNYRGNTFTWINNRESDPRAKKLDRILVNDTWMINFPNSIGIFGEMAASDHSPCCVFLDSKKEKKTIKNF